MRRFLALVVVWCLFTTLFAQDWNAMTDDFDLDEEAAESEEWTQYLIDLKDLHDNPLNINTASQEDLRQLPFLNEQQIEDIHAYIYLHGEMQTLAELLLIRSLDVHSRRLLRLFTYAETSPRQKRGLFNDLHHDFSTRLDVPLYYRRGQLTKDGYRGNGLYHRMRYTLKGKRLQAGLRIEKDPGERFYDSYGGYAMVQQVGSIQRAIVGDYRAAFGEGLVMGGGAWHLNSTPSLRRQGGIRPLTGMSESDFLRGVAVWLSLGKGWNLSVFVSHQRVDATLNNIGEVKTLLTTGYHRTASEWERRRNVRATLAGGNITWQHKGLYAGATGYYQTFSKPLNPGTETYRRIYPHGSHFGVMGVFYGYRWHDLTFGGETAFSTEQRGLATLNRLTYMLNGRHTFSVVQRYYNEHYYSFHASATGDGSRTQNENGLLLHWKGEPWGGWRLMAYADFFFHRWPSYGMTHSNQGQELMAQAEFTPNNKHTFLMSYRWKNKEAYDKPDPHHRLKAQWTFTPKEAWTCAIVGALHHAPASTGWGLQTRVGHQWRKPHLRCTASVAYAHTTDYQSRIYFYEPSLYQTVSNLSLYGNCLRAALTARWTTWKERLMLEARYGMLHYFDRDTQSSALQTIYSSWKNDIQIQVRIQL